jgi:hypothetical protein
LALALSTLLNIITKYAFVPGKVENWIVIIDTKCKGMTEIPITVRIFCNNIHLIGYQYYSESSFSMLPRNFGKIVYPGPFLES